MKGKFIKKLVAYAMVAAIVITTPQTAFAADFVDNFWVSDGNDENNPIDPDTGEAYTTGTGTVSSTNTDTNTNTTVGPLINNGNVTGIVIKEKGGNTNNPGIVLNVPDKASTTLVAEIQVQGEGDEAEATKSFYNKKITWRSSDLSIVRPAAKAGNRAECQINAYKGGFANITAEIDVDGDGNADFMARVRVMVKKKVTDFTFAVPDNKLYAGHTYNLEDYIQFNDGEFDVATFKVDTTKMGKKQKLVTWGSDGILSLNKSIKDKDGLKIDVTVTVGDIPEKTVEISLSEGVPVTKMVLTGEAKKPVYDISKDYDEDKEKPSGYKYTRGKNSQSLKLSITTKGGNTTDDITWTSSDSNIVRIKAADENPLNVKTEKLTKTDINNESKREVKFEGLKVGKATITAKSTSGKTAKINVEVTATLIKIVSATIDGNETWSGKTTPINIVRIPTQNTDKLKVTIPKGEKAVKGKAAINPVITPVVDLVKIGADGKEISGVKVEQAKAAKGKVAETRDVTAFKVKQSDVEITSVLKAQGTWKDAKKMLDIVYPNRFANYKVDVNLSHCTPGLDAVSWASGKETVAQIVANGRVKVVGEGTAKITVSSVYNKDGKYKTIKKTFTIKSTPQCQEIVLKSNVVAAKAGAKNAVVNIKEQRPKKAADDIEWYAYKVTTDGVEILADAIEKSDNKKCTIKGNQLTTAGTVITVVARSKNNGVEAEAKVVVIPAK